MVFTVKEGWNLKRIRHTFAIFVLILCLLPSSIHATLTSDSSLTAPVLDAGNFLSDGEEASLVMMIEALKTKTGFDIGIIMMDESAYYYNFLSEVKNSIAPKYFTNNRFIFAFNMSNREVLIEVNGTARDRMSDTQTDLFLDEITGHLQNEDYYTSGKVFLELLDSRLSGEVTSVEKNYLQQVDSGEKSSVLLISFFMSLVIASLTTLFFVQSMNNVKTQDNAVSYTEQGSFHVSHNRERFLYRNITKVPRPQNNSSGGRSGGGSLGGRSSGGRSRGF